MVCTAVHRDFIDGMERQGTSHRTGQPFGLLKPRLGMFDCHVFGCFWGTCTLAIGLSILHGVHVTEFPLGLSHSDMQSAPAKALLDSSWKNAIEIRPYHHADEALLSSEAGEIFGMVKIGRKFSTVPQYRFVCRAGIEGDDSSEKSVLDLDIETASLEIRFLVQKTIVASQKVSLPNSRGAPFARLSAACLFAR